MSAADLYPRPSRAQIAARVAPGTEGDDLSDIVRRKQESLDPLACFATHLAARMRVLGWDQARLQELAGITSHVAAKAINGTGCDLSVAGKIAAVVGGYLAAMIGPYACGTCAGEPPKGFGCLECGAEARAS